MISCTDVQSPEECHIIVSACLLYWCIYRIVKYNKDIKALEETEKRLKEE